MPVFSMFASLTVALLFSSQQVNAGTPYTVLFGIRIDKSFNEYSIYEMHLGRGQQRERKIPLTLLGD